MLWGDPTVQFNSGCVFDSIRRRKKKIYMGILATRPQSYPQDKWGVNRYSKTFLRGHFSQGIQRLALKPRGESWEAMMVYKLLITLCETVISDGGGFGS